MAKGGSRGTGRLPAAPLKSPPAPPRPSAPAPAIPVSNRRRGSGIPPIPKGR
jgi:hypothetical protein